MCHDKIVICEDKKARVCNLIFLVFIAVVFLWLANHCGPNDRAIFFTLVVSASAMMACILYTITRSGIQRERIYLTDNGVEDIYMKTGFIPFEEIGECCPYRSHDGSVQGVALELKNKDYGIPGRKKLSKTSITLCRLEGYSTDSMYVDAIVATSFTTMDQTRLYLHIKECITGNERVEREVSARKSNSLTVKEALIQGLVLLSITAVIFALVLYTN